MHARNRIGAALLLSSLVGWGGVGVASASEPSASDCFISQFKTGDAKAVAACYAENAVMWFPGGPLATGRAAIQDGFAGYFSRMTVKEVQLTEMGQESLGDAKASWGTYKIRAVEKATGAESVEHGRYTDVTRKIDGRWQYLVDHPSDDPSAPMAAE